MDFRKRNWKSWTIRNLQLRWWRKWLPSTLHLEWSQKWIVCQWKLPMLRLFHCRSWTIRNLQLRRRTKRLPSSLHLEWSQKWIVCQWKLPMHIKLNSLLLISGIRILAWKIFENCTVMKIFCLEFIIIIVNFANFQ